MKLISGIALSMLSGLAIAAGDPGGGSVPGAQVQSDPVMERVAAATSRKDWPAAQAILKDAVASDPKNADYHNLYAYSIRKGANPDMNLVFKHYNAALSIDPKHKAAHEYLGEAYLMVKNPAKAKEHLALLDKLCFLPCSEYTDLKDAIASYERQGASR